MVRSPKYISLPSASLRLRQHGLLTHFHITDNLPYLTEQSDTKGQSHLTELMLSTEVRGDGTLASTFVNCHANTATTEIPRVTESGSSSVVA